MGGGGVEVAADAAPAGEGGQGMPVAGDGLMALGGFRAALGTLFVQLHGEVPGEQEDLFPVVAQPGPQRVSGVVPGRPSPAAGCGLSRRRRRCRSVPAGLRVPAGPGRFPRGPGGLDGLMGLAEDRR